jgi:hypothetical protein
VPDNAAGYPGLTIRDYFAAKAMVALIVASKGEIDDVRAAKVAYRQADLMLTQRGVA